MKSQSKRRRERRRLQKKDPDFDYNTDDHSSGGADSDPANHRDEYKMVLCVNQELGMGKGKIAAQCCHAALGCYTRALKHCPRDVQAWERNGSTKIALKCPSLGEIESIAMKAMKKNLPVYLVEDAGRTQIDPGSKTVLGIGPAPASALEGITSHLKLL